MIYNNIKALCDKKGISIKDLEREAGLGSGTIYKWQKVSPSIENLQAVAGKLGVKVTKLIE